MSKRFDGWLIVLTLILASRMVPMALLPFADTTEPRYAEITRLMLASGDWITPWFEPGVPFWGKPPLSFWAQALTGKLFGLSEFSLRLPSWLASIGIIALAWCYARQLWGAAAAHWSALVLSTMSLLYVSAGTVMTDSWLALGTTLSLVSFGMVIEGKRWHWLFFLGLVIGLLAKGPLAVALCVLPIALWLGWHKERWKMLYAFPWIAGLAITVFVAAPWYIAAELKTPGFLNYFIVGEHFLRFVDAGWAGDMYGNAHDEPKGMIWAFWVMAAFPWSFVILPALIMRGIRHNGDILTTLSLREPRTQFLLYCTLGPLLFFTVAGNILWTYTLPALPFTAMLLGRWLALSIPARPMLRSTSHVLTLLTPTLLFAISMAATFDLFEIKTEKNVVAHYEEQKNAYDSPLFYLDKTPFSARFYSGGTARDVTLERLQKMLTEKTYRRFFLAVPIKSDEATADTLPPHTVEVENSSFRLVSFSNHNVPEYSVE